MSKKLEKVSIIGTGNVGSTCAFLLTINGLADVSLFDKFENIAQAKALDIGQAGAAFNSDGRVRATQSLADLAGSKVVIFTAGIPRKPGMNRQDLIKINSDIAKEVALNIKKYAPGAIVIVVSNPLDILTWLVLKETGFDRSRVFGMAGLVDNSRLRYFMAEKKGVNPKRIESHVLGLHADRMVIPEEQIRVNGQEGSVDKNSISDAKEKTRGAGAQIVGLLKNGSAFYLPGTGAYLMAKAVINDSLEFFDACVYLKGEYGLKGVCLGVPAIVGKEGIEQVKEIELSEQSKNELKENASIFKQQLELL